MKDCLENDLSRNMTKKNSILAHGDCNISINEDLHDTTVVHDLYSGKYDQMRRMLLLDDDDDDDDDEK